MIEPISPDFDHTPANPTPLWFSYVPENAETTPAVTIVTPFDNAGLDLYETAITVFRQSLQEWEWLIVNDDAEELQSLAILEEFRKQDGRIRVIDHTKRRGRSAVLNTGFTQATTEYLLFLNSGDLLEPTALEKLRWFLVSHPEYAFAGANRVTFGSRQSLSVGIFSDGFTGVDSNQAWPTAMVRHAMFEATGGFDETIPQELADWEFFMHCASLGHWGGNIPEYLIWQRERQSQNDNRKPLDEARLAEFIDEIRRRYIQLWQGNFTQPEIALDLDLTQIAIHSPFENQLQNTGQRLLILMPWMEMGGAERFILNLMRQMIKNGWQISVLATAPAMHAWQYEFEKISSDIFPLHSFLSWRDIPRFINYFIRSRKFDAMLISGSIEGYRLLPHIRHQFPKLAILDYLHSIIPYWMDGGTPRLSTMYQDCLDLDIASCHQVKQWMIDQGTPADRIRVCPINVDADFWRPDAQVRSAERASLCAGEDQTLILYVARLEPEKQPQVFANVMLDLHRKNLPFRGLVIGDGTSRSWMEQFIKERNLQGSIHLFGEQPAQRVRDLMTASDILFLPSKGEGISQVIFEAMSCGLAIVSAAVGGQAELVTPQCGVLLTSTGKEEDDSDAYASILQQLILNPELRQSMGQTSRERIQAAFRLEQMGHCMTNCIQESMRLSREKPRLLESDRLAQCSARETVEYLQAAYEAKRAWRSFEQKERSFKQMERSFEQMEKQYLQAYDDYLRAIQPLSAREYFYLGFRGIVFPIYLRLQASRLGGWMLKLKNMIKPLVVH